ncbi:MBL fold metallo-hydrolase [Pseudoalteromonas sp. SSDWG2]|uniref:MBL fold metallo-hydrolase n=1 Tax=Pseudoalteromonas sp. SSDWG2 TaxID=3139391 RepID=UPI003BAD61CB
MRNYLIAIALAAVTTAAGAQQTWQSVSEHVTFVQQSEKLRFYDSNQALIQGQQCALLVDAPGEFAQTQAFIDVLKDKLTAPLCYLLVSHAHDDHLLGLAMVQQHFPDAQLIVHTHLGEAFHRAHQQLNERLDGFAKSIALSEQRMAQLPEDEQGQWQEKITRAKARLANWQDLSFKEPKHIVGSTESFDLGGVAVQVQPLSAHTEGDLVVLVETDKVLVGADIVDMLPYPGEGNFASWISALQTFSALPLEAILPGHGALMNKTQLAQPSQWLKAIQTHVQENPDSDLASLVGSFPKQFEPTEEGLQKRAYAMFLEAGIKRAMHIQREAN